MADRVYPYLMGKRILIGKEILIGKGICLIFTLISIIGSLLYLIYFDAPCLWNFIGIFLLLTDILLMVFLQIIAQRLERSFTKKALIFHGSIILKYGILFLANFIGYGYQTWANVLLGFLIYGSVWVTQIMGVKLVFQGYHIMEKQDAQNETQQESHSSDFEMPKLSKKRIISLFIIAVIAVFGLYGGITMDAAILMPLDRMSGSFAAGIMAGMMGIFFGIVDLAFTGILLISISYLWSHREGKQILTRKKAYVLGVIAILGLLIASMSFLPLLSTPNFIHNAENDFNEAFDPSFGGDWQSGIPSSVEDSNFLSAPFQLAGYILGSPTYDCITLKDILYFNGSTSTYSQDNAITLYFDAFLPPNNGQGLPGENSTLIRFHGGGWVIGDKALQNMNQMNRYFAAQGYCVFDIQYGLNNVSTLFASIPGTPTNVLGNFTLDDILRHIGNFTFFLEEHAEEYGANLDSVFISGGSAGGQLTSATALSLTHGNYSIFSSALTVKGQIPYYPANNAQLDFILSSRPEWINPDLLVDVNSPPCLIYQGDRDSLYPRALTHQQAYFNLGREDCAFLVFRYAGHASDLYFMGYYSQVFLYYMERFMYLYH
ncbi:MAG: alpha/beta hydrolase [Promethearchaeota archaeon]